MVDSFIPLSRALLEWDWHDEPKTGWLYVVMLMMANHEETRWRGETLRRGQLLTGRQHLSAASGLTDREVRTAMEHLKKTGDIKIESRSRYSIVTMLKYDVHCPAERPINDQQSDQQSDQQNDQQSDQQNVQQATGIASDERPAERPEEDQQATGKRPAGDHIQKLKNLKNLKKAAEDAPAREEGLVAYNTPDMAAIEDMWQRMGNRVTANDLFRFEQAIADGHSVQDILDAMKEADEHGARESWAYVKTVLQNWRDGGRRGKPQEMSAEALYGEYV